jgi:predicted metal-dependent hydrolase
VQLDLPFLRRPEPVIEPTPPVTDDAAIDFVRVRRARRYIVRVRPDGRVRVTIPRGGSRAEGQRFVERHTRWIHRQRARVREDHAPRTWTDGTPILLSGRPATITRERDGDRLYAVYGRRRVQVPADAADLRPFVERDLRALAHAVLPSRLHALAAAHALSVGRITIRNQRSRWGSCSRSGDIALNFRLVQMPPEVSDYVLLHELMHITVPNHSRRFWRLVERACPAFRDAERWLKTEGPGLF